jgi:hypothetical protein
MSSRISCGSHRWISSSSIEQWTVIVEVKERRLEAGELLSKLMVEGREMEAMATTRLSGW